MLSRSLAALVARSTQPTAESGPTTRMRWHDRIAGAPALAGARALLGSRFGRNLGSMGGAQIAIRVSRLATTVLLARLLTPHDYGLAAIVLTVYELVALFTRNGISAKVVQAGEDEVAQVAETAQTLTWIICGGLLLLQALLALPIAWAYHDHALALPIALMGLIYLATPLCNIQGAMLQRQGRLGRIALTSAVQVVTDNLLTAGLALAGLGMWAIILPKLLVAPIWVIGLRTAHPWRARCRWSLAGWREILHFSRSVVGVELLTTLQANVDNLIVGYLLGTHALGLYYFAYNAGLGITLGLIGSFGVAIYPHLCEVRQDPVALAARFHRTRHTVALLTVPVILLQVVLAPVYVPLVFGAHWSAAVPVLMLIGLSALARPFAVTCSQLMRAAGRPEIELRWQAALTLLLVVGLLAGAAFGVIGVAAAVLLVQGGVLSLYALRAPRQLLREARPEVAAGEASFELVRDPAGLAMLEAEWDALWRRADRPVLSQSFAWCRAGWETTARPRGRRLCVLVMRQAGRTVLIWPLARRGSLLAAEALPLGPEGTEYAPILVEAGPEAVERVRAAWSFCERRRLADIVTVPFVRADSVSAAVLSTVRRPHRAHSLPAPFTRFAAGQSWPDYLASLAPGQRRELARRRRRMAERGEVVFDAVEGGDELVRLIDWALARKKDWMARTGATNDFLATPEFRAFLVAMARRPSPLGHLVALVLQVSGQPVAVKIGAVDGVRYEGFITTYDPAWYSLSPGQILLVDALQWCHARGLEHDFRIGDEPYKRDWANGEVLATTWRVAMSARGALQLRLWQLGQQCREARDRLRLAIPEARRRQVKQLASGLLPRGRSAAPSAASQQPSAVV
jgi:PST family polysaccharide transporter